MVYCYGQTDSQRSHSTYSPRVYCGCEDVKDQREGDDDFHYQSHTDGHVRAKSVSPQVSIGSVRYGG